MKLTIEQLEARYEALNDCAEHLGLTWSDNTVELAEGNKMADWLRRESLKWLKKANAERERRDGKRSRS